MHYFWSKFVVGFLACEIIVFGFFYYFGVHGIVYLNQLKEQRIELKQEIKKSEDKIEELKKHIDQWKDDDFLKEKYAREKLYLQKDKETIFFR